MGNWGRKLGIKHVKLLPYLQWRLYKKNGGQWLTNTTWVLVLQSWRYSMVVNNGKIEKIFEEPGMRSNCPSDPFTCSDVNTMILYLKSKK